MLEKIEPSLPGFSDVFLDKGEYGIKGGIVRINPSTRTYIDGKVIDKNLPAVYQLGNKNPNSVENPNVPKNQHCGNCVFNKNGNCTKWEAMVKKEFWCKAYKGKSNKEASIDSTSTPPSIQRNISPTPSNIPSSNRGGGSY